MKWITWALFWLVVLFLLWFGPWLPAIVFHRAKAEAPEPVPIKEYAFVKVVETFGRPEWENFEEIIRRESGWTSSRAQNPQSSAFGLAQFLNSTWKTVGCVKTEDAYIQIDCAVKYIQSRYNTPTQAKLFHDRNNHY